MILSATWSYFKHTKRQERYDPIGRLMVVYNRDPKSDSEDNLFRKTEVTYVDGREKSRQTWATNPTGEPIPPKPNSKIIEPISTGIFVQQEDGTCLVDITENNLTVRVRFDVFGNIIDRYVAKGLVVSFEYDNYGRQLSSRTMYLPSKGDPILVKDGVTEKYIAERIENGKVVDRKFIAIGDDQNLKDGWVITGVSTKITETLFDGWWHENYDLFGNIELSIKPFEDNKVAEVIEFDYGPSKILRGSSSTLYRWDVAKKTLADKIETIKTSTVSYDAAGNRLSLVMNKVTHWYWQESMDAAGRLTAKIGGAENEKGEFEPIYIELSEYEGLYGAYGIGDRSYTYAYKPGKGLDVYNPKDAIIKAFRDKTVDPKKTGALYIYDLRINEKALFSWEELQDSRGRPVMRYTLGLYDNKSPRPARKNGKNATKLEYDDNGQPVLAFSGIAHIGTTYALNNNGDIDRKRIISQSVFKEYDKATGHIIARVNNFKKKLVWEEEKDGKGRLVQLYKGKVDVKNWKTAAFKRERVTVLHYDKSDSSTSALRWLMDVADMGQTYILNEDGSHYEDTPFMISWFTGFSEEGYVNNQIVNLKTVESWYELKDPMGLLMSSLSTYENQDAYIIPMKEALSENEPPEKRWGKIKAYQSQEKMKTRFDAWVREDLYYKYGAKDYGVYEIPDSTKTTLLGYLPKGQNFERSSSIIVETDDQGNITYLETDFLTGVARIIMKNKDGLPIKIKVGYMRPGTEVKPEIGNFISINENTSSYEGYYGRFDIADSSETWRIDEKGQRYFVTSKSNTAGIDKKGEVCAKETLYRMAPGDHIVESHTRDNYYKQRGNRRTIIDISSRAVINFDKWGLEYDAYTESIGFYPTVVNKDNKLGINRSKEPIKTKNSKVISRGVMHNPYFPDREPEFYTISKVDYCDNTGEVILYSGEQWTDRFGNVIVDVRRIEEEKKDKGGKTIPGSGKSAISYYFTKDGKIPYAQNADVSKSPSVPVGINKGENKAIDIGTSEFIYLHLDDSEVTGGPVSYSLEVSDGTNVVTVNNFWQAYPGNALILPSNTEATRVCMPTMTSDKVEDNSVKLVAVKELIRLAKEQKKPIDLSAIQSVSLVIKKTVGTKGAIRISDIYRLGDISKNTSAIHGELEKGEKYSGKDTNITPDGRMHVIDRSKEITKMPRAEESKTITTVFKPDGLRYYDQAVIKHVDEYMGEKTYITRIIYDDAGQFPVASVTLYPDGRRVIHVVKVTLGGSEMYVYRLNPITMLPEQDAYKIDNIRSDMPISRKMGDFVYLANMKDTSGAKRQNRYENNLANVIMNKALDREKQPSYPTAPLSDESLKYVARVLKEHYPELSINEKDLKKAENPDGMQIKEIKKPVFWTLRNQIIGLMILLFFAAKILIDSRWFKKLFRKDKALKPSPGDGEFKAEEPPVATAIVAEAVATGPAEEAPAAELSEELSADKQKLAQIESLKEESKKIEKEQKAAVKKIPWAYTRLIVTIIVSAISITLLAMNASNLGGWGVVAWILAASYPVFLLIYAQFWEVKWRKWWDTI
ncbi:MAG: hypothetical protein NT036_03490, partial [Candidatus Omnitrophica bacterium]|nr:hypothetical protein [Candidatus Omnitrophota bacterium]